MNDLSLTLAKEFGMTPQQFQVITNTIAKNATLDELRLFLMVAKRTGLDPFTKQIYFVKRKQRNADGTFSEVGAVQTGIDGYRAIAQRTGELAGIDDAVYDDEKGEHPNKATVTIYKMVNGQKVSFTASARWKEYAVYYGGKLANLWAKMPFLMLAKCAETLALRKAFPNDLSGIYTNDEMGQADNEPRPMASKVILQPAVDKETGEIIEKPLPQPPKIENRVTEEQGQEIANLWKNVMELTETPQVEWEAKKINTLQLMFNLSTTTDLTQDQARMLIEKLQEKIAFEMKKKEKQTVLKVEDSKEAPLLNEAPKEPEKKWKNPPRHMRAKK